MTRKKEPSPHAFQANNSDLLVELMASKGKVPSSQGGRREGKGVPGLCLKKKQMFQSQSFPSPNPEARETGSQRKTEPDRKRKAEERSRLKSTISAAWRRAMDPICWDDQES